MTGPTVRAIPRFVRGNAQDLVKLYMNSNIRERKRVFVKTSCIAKQVGLSIRTIQAWIEADEIEAVRIGRNYYVYRPSLDHYLLTRNEDIH